MVDAINLVFVQDLAELLVELFRRGQIVTKRLFDDDSRPPSVLLFRQATQTPHFDDGREESGRHRQIKEPITQRVVLPIRLGDLLLEAFVRFRVLKITFDVIDALAHPVEELWVDRRRGELRNLLHERSSKALRSEVVHRKANDCKLLGKEFFLGQIAKRRDELAFGQVAGSPANGHYARGSKRVCVWVIVVHQLKSLYVVAGRPRSNQWPAFFSMCPPNW